MKKFKFPMRYVPISATILVFFVVYLVGIICFENFGSPRVFLDLFTDNAYLGIAAIGTALVILTGGIDLSVGSIIAFTSILIAKIISMKPLVEGHPACNALFAIALALVIGILFGMLQGWLIYNFSLPPFLVTLAGMFFIRGCGFIVSEESIGIKNDPVFDFIQKDLSVTMKPQPRMKNIPASVTRNGGRLKL